MPNAVCETTPNPEILLDIIDLQSRIVRLGLDLGKVMEFAAQEAQRLSHAGGAVVELVEDDEMVYRAATGIAKAQLGLRIKRKGSLSGLCIESRKTLICSDCEEDPRVDRIACRRVGLRSMAVAPLFCNDALVGVLKIAAPGPNHFTDEHVCILRLISESIAASMFYAAKYEISELYHRATHDALTGLANRALFYDHLRQSLALARRKSLLMGVLNLDMDGLKRINDNHGHRAGDAAIIEMARRIARSTRESDLAARLGGDEFGVILPEVSGHEGARAVVEKMQKELSAPFLYEGEPLNIGASVGAAVFPMDAEELDALIEAADRRMYAEKRSRKSDTREAGEKAK